LRKALRAMRVLRAFVQFQLVCSASGNICGKMSKNLKFQKVAIKLGGEIRFTKISNRIHITEVQEPEKF
jgi:hypothetical protein